MPRLLEHPFTLIILTLLALSLWVSFWFNSREIRQSSLVVERLETQVSQEEQAVADLEKQLEAARSQTNQEAIIRNELLMQKPGEYIVQMPEITLSERQQAVQAEHLTPWQKWQKVLGLTLE